MKLKKRPKPSKTNSEAWLFLDTRLSDRATVGLLRNGAFVYSLEKVRRGHVPVPVLQLLHGAVQRANELRQELAGIVFVNGPGGFTSLRTGLAVAQTLAYAWKLPIVHAPSEAKSEILRSIAMRAKAHRLAYGRAPSITKPKVRPRPKRALR